MQRVRGRHLLQGPAEVPEEERRRPRHRRQLVVVEEHHGARAEQAAQVDEVEEDGVEAVVAVDEGEIERRPSPSIRGSASCDSSAWYPRQRRQTASSSTCRPQLPSLTW